MVENVRAGRRIFQRRALYLGELNDSQRAEWDPSLSFKDALFFFLRERWAGLFGSTCDVVLFDLTSTYFEVDGA